MSPVTQPGLLSRLFWARFALGIAFAVFVGWACFTPAPPSPAAFPGADKVEHAAAMAWLALWFAALFKHRIVYVALGVAAYGGLIEVVQAFLSYRNADMLDFGADCAGAAIGAGIVFTIVRLWKKRENPEWRQSSRTS